MSDVVTRQPGQPNLTAVVASETGDIPVDQFVPCFGLCCAILSFVSDLKTCVGCSAVSTLCCLSSRQVLCKPSVESVSYCKLCLVDCDIDPCNDCISTRTQCCCLDLRAAIPPDGRVPCMLTICFWTMAYNCHLKCKCCSTIGDMKE